jgi:exonuclease SbcC
VQADKTDVSEEIDELIPMVKTAKEDVEMKLQQAFKMREQLEETANHIFNQIEQKTEQINQAEKKTTQAESRLKFLNEQAEITDGKLQAAKENYEKKLAEQKIFSGDEFLAYAVSESDITRNRKIVENYESDVKANALQLKQAAADAQGKEKTDLAVLEQEIAQSGKLAEQLRQSEGAVKNRIAENTDIHAKIEGLQEQLGICQKRKTICERLYQLVAGQITGKGKAKITLEQYIQAAGFDHIIAAANRRLLPMSDGQYELSRRETPSDIQSKSILNLDVLDHFTGRKRPVGSLSGGESFQASLSLALGLSDTITANAGGIQMEALFIDEGFGSLDKHAIDNAMELLVSLSDNHKLIGIISHREELMENIPQQILVKKTTGGSTLSIKKQSE